MKIKNTICSLTSLMLGGLMATNATAWEYNHGRYAFRLTGYGTVGVFQPEFHDGDFLGDWRVRGQMNFAPRAGQTLGAVYAIDAIAVNDGRPMREAFGFYEHRKYGRIELGATDSIARKLGVGLPDVGGLRVNDRPIFYKKITPRGPIIGDTTLSTGRRAMRINLASMPTHRAQYGLSVAGLTDDFKFATDMGIKFRYPTGKLKTAVSLGASYMDAPDNYRGDVFAPNVTADWRAQFSAGLNIQYNSWIVGLTGRVIYDKNPIGIASDGIAAGAGVSYDLLKYSLSLSYLLSDTDVWDNRDGNINHTGILSLRYKYSKNVDGWMSIGISSEKSFLAAGLRATF